MRNNFSDFNLLALSALHREAALNTFHDLDTTFPVERGNLLNLQYVREDNKSMLTGKEEPDEIYAGPSTSEGSLEAGKAQAQHFGFGYAFALGACSSAAEGTGYKHTITPISGQLPSFTAAQRYGANILKRRYASLFLDSLTASFERGGWAKLTMGLKGTGKIEENVVKEIVAAAGNATEITVSTAVQGASVDSVHGVTFEKTAGEWVDVVVTAVAGAVITIVPPDVDPAVRNYRVVYVPTEPAWCTFPARIIEPPLQVANMTVKIGAKWSGAAITGGHDVAAQLKSLEHSINNGVEIVSTPGGNGQYGDWASRAVRAQKLVVNRELRDYLLQQNLKDNDVLVVQVKLVGPEYEAGKNYGVEIIFPRVGLVTAPISIDGRVLAEAGDLAVLEDGTYGSVRVFVTNKVATYAAA